MKKKLILITLWSILLSSPLFGTWYYYTVNQANINTSIDLNSQGIPYVAYLEYANAYPMVSYLNTGSNSFVAMPTVNYTASDQIAIALDQNDNPHVLYRDVLGVMYHGAWNGASWSAEVIDTNCQYFQIDFDNNNVLHLVYLDYEDPDVIKYMRYEQGSGWTTEPVDAGGIHISLTIDESNNPHITYRLWSDGSIKYASRIGGSWTSEVVQSASDLGHPSITVRSGIPHISYTVGGTLNDLRYTYKSGGSWNISDADNGDVYPSHGTAIGLNNTGESQIAYVCCVIVPPPIKFYLWCAHWLSTPGTWWTEQVDPQNIGNGSGAYGCIDLAMDIDDHIHISYNDNGYNCFYATTNPTIGIEEQSVNTGTHHASLTIVTNPFIDKTEIRYCINRKGVSNGTTFSNRSSNPYLKIYDASSRLVKQLALLTTYSSMPAITSWDGTDDSGHKLPSGVYFVRLETETGNLTKKAILLR
jgi:hypothetical protein